MMQKCEHHGATPRQRGMTLIEMMVTLSVLGLLAAIAIPSLRDWLRDARQATQSDLLVSSLATARLEAVKRRSTISICPASDADTASACSSSDADWSKGWLILGPNDVVQRVRVPAGVTIADAPDSLGFNATFGSAQAAATFTVCSKGGRQHRIDVSLSGHINKRITSTVCA
ncbi:GspH/FimT family pseudopilin [Chitinilyticum litopenaei]|uniref:GspH/FimT family pseudopilin n=1 Tax=Chitinilyticum litopenaei TaxID=1121276 RepID=UPI00040DB7C2|nr:GspH/FimT family pseudopilin [Chitinilyticum litopenaei]